MKDNKTEIKEKVSTLFRYFISGLLFAGCLLAAPGVEAKEKKRWPDFILFLPPLIVGFVMVFVGEKLTNTVLKLRRD